MKWNPIKTVRVDSFIELKNLSLSIQIIGQWLEFEPTKIGPTIFRASFFTEIVRLFSLKPRLRRFPKPRESAIRHLLLISFRSMACYRPSTLLLWFLVVVVIVVELLSDVTALTMGGANVWRAQRIAREMKCKMVSIEGTSYIQNNFEILDDNRIQKLLYCYPVYQKND